MGRPRHATDDAERVTLRLDPDLAGRLRVLAASQKRAMSALAEEAIGDYLVKAEKAWASLRKAEPPRKGKESREKFKGPHWSPEAVRRELARLKLPQAALAEALGIRPALLSLWLCTRGIPSHRQEPITMALKELRKTMP